MPRDNRPSPRWLSSSTKRVDGHTQDYERDLKAVAVRIAKRDRSETVGERHVEEAYRAVHRFGSSSLPWWQKTEAEVGAGAVLLGSLWSVPDVVGFFLSPPTDYYVGIALMVVAAGIGVGLVLHGWFRSKLA